MRNGAPVTPALETQTRATLPAMPENPADLSWTNDENHGQLFFARDQENDRLFEINSQLRRDRIARSRRDDALYRKLSQPRLVCADGNIVGAGNEPSASDLAYLAALVALCSWIERCAVYQEEP
jgi:hypothetical protein